ncbi:Putative protein kinase C delta type-like protein [Camponotus floridanus]|uniref:AGC-kinase C-terminal domain-containing protein n=1 Tax=Camponotus floridanus TaxID=104421 RepID=E2A8A9_CAMFO|nr:Putative protein kinase C delta type-like protein [Camponotus floridanus]
MPYYNDVPYYYGGASYANHSSLMTGTGRTPFHTPLTSRFSPHLSTISESPLNQLHRFAIRSPPISVRRVRQVIDTKDIDVSSPRILSHNGNRPRNRLQRNRPTIKIRSQALKDNPVLREHNEKHEKSVGELLMEKFFIKDTKLDGDGNQQIRLYHQVSLNQLENPQEQEAIQKRITRRFTRRRSSADLQLSPEQLQQKVAYAEVQAKVLDSLVAEEQAQIENEIRQGTLMRKDTTTRGSIAHSYYTDSDTTQEEKKTARLKKTMNKTKKRKKSTIDNSWLADKIDNRQSSTCNEVSTDSEIEEKSNGPKPQMYKIEACNSTGDFSTIWMNASSENEKCKSMVEQFRESVKIPIPRTFETENKIDTFPKNVDETEMQIVLPMRKPYVKDSSRNSVYLTVRKPTEKLEEKLEEIERLNNNENQLNLTNGFVDVKKDDELNSLTNKDSLESNDDVQTINDIKDATLKKIPDKPKKIKSSAKTNIYSTLDNNLNLESKDSLKSNDDVQTTNDIKDIKEISDESKKLEPSSKKNIYSTLDNNLNIGDKNSLKSNDDVQMTNEVKDITLKKIPDKPKKIKSSAKTNIYSALDNNLNLESKELKSNDIQTTNDIKDIKEISDESKKLEPSSKKNIYSTLDNNLNIGDKNSLKSNDDVQMTSDVKDITLKKISDESKPKQLESLAKKNIYSTLDKNLNIEDKTSLKSNDDVQMTNEVKDITLKKIPDKFKKMEWTKKNSTLDNNLNTGNKIASKTNSDVQENDKNDAPLSKSAEKSMQSSVPTFISTKNDAQNHDAQIKQLPKNIVTNIKKDESEKNDTVITAMKNLDCLKTVSTIEMPGDLTTKDSFTSKTDKFTEEKDKLKMSATLRDATKRSVVSSEANDNAGENSANSATCHLPKPSKINTDRNNVIEAPELSLRETAQYLANPPESVEAVLTLPEKKMNKESNLAKTPFFNAPKKINSVDANKSTLKIGVTQTNDIANLVTKGMTLLKEMNDEVRSTDSNEEMKSITEPSKVDLNTETPKNEIEKPNGNISRKLSIKMINPSKIETEIITTKKLEPKESNLLKTDIKKIDNVDIEKDSGDSDLSNLKNNVPKLDAAKSKFKTKTFPKTAANETDKMVSSKIKKDSDIFKITKSNDDKSILFPQKERDMPRNLKKGIPVDSKKSMNDCLSNNISNVQQSASVNEKTADKIPIKKEPTKPLNKITEEPTKLLSKITEKKPVTVDVSYDKSQEKGGQLSKSASTESIDFWSEIKAASSPEGMKSKQESGFSFYETTITKVENIDPTNCMFNDSLAEKKSLITSVKNSDDKKNKTNVEKGVIEFSNSMIEPSNVVVEEEKEKEKTIVEPPRVKNKETAKLIKTTEKTAPKVLLKKKKNLSIAIGAKDSNSTVKKAPLKHDSAISIQPDSTTPDATTVAASEVSTSVPEVTIPIINIIEECNEDFNSHKIDDENSKTPTNEPSSDLFLTATISKWSNQDNLTNSDDVETPVVSEETSLVGSPIISPSSVKTKHSTKKKKTSTKKTSTKSEKEVKIRSNESTITSQQKTLIPEKQFSAKPSPNSSPRNTPSQRPLDLIRMFYTTPSALLTATPRDLSKIRRAKIKKRRHQLKTPSVSSDSTGSTTSTATTGSTDGSRSTCVELDDDSEHKNSTRSNDSGFDGSPRILNCDMACHKKCEKLTGNLCGLNQKLVAEALQALKRAPSQSSDNQRNSDISERFPSGRITPPATNLPRFKKYAVTDFNFLKIIKGLKYNHAVDWWSYGVLLYEMLTGQSPFSGCDEDELFWSICNERPFIPRYLSQEASDMLICLLEKDSAKRPPSHEIAMHAFFQHLPWDRLERRQLEPPFKPAIDHTLDTKYFDTAFTTERPRLTPVPEQILTSMDQGVFRGFSYTNPNATD